MRNKLLILTLSITFLLLQTLLNGNHKDKKETKERFAIVVGANYGGEKRVKLRYALSDAKSIKKVLEHMGGVGQGKTIYLENPTRQAFLLGMDRLKAIVNNAKNEHKKVEVIFYYSGHSDEESIFLGQERITYKEFKDIIKGTQADVKIAILDSCASGAFTRLKGGKKVSPLMMNNAYDMKGFAFMTSSSADETSQESDKIAGSYFTHYLVSGLHGAADLSGEGIVTLNEAYQYAYRETLSKTEKTIRGPQHPNYNIQMSGKGDVIMTDVRQSSARLILTKDISGRLFIHNQDDVLVVEINKPYGRSIDIGLEKGKYKIINLRNGHIYEKEIKMSTKEICRLQTNQFKKVDEISTTARGIIDDEPEQSTVKKLKRYKIEIFGGFSKLNPKDLNLAVQHREDAISFFRNDYFEFLQNLGNLSSFSIKKEGEFKPIDNALTWGLSLRYFYNRSFSISFGLEFISKSQDSIVNIKHTNVYKYGGIWEVHEDYSPYNIFSKAVIPTVGIHLGKEILSWMEVEGLIRVGLIFAKCGYSYEIENRETDSIDDQFLTEHPYYTEGIYHEKGKGTGINLEGGARINIDVTGNFGLFLEGGYAYRIVKKISGSGNYTNESTTESWSGDWEVKENSITTDWDSTQLQWPSCNSQWNNTYQLKTRDFNLDLSGIRFKIGIFYRF